MPSTTELLAPATALLQLQFSESVIRKNVGDFTHEESLRVSPNSNGLNFVLAHVIATRSHFLAGLGGEPVWSDAECQRFDRHASPVNNRSEFKPLAELWTAFELTQKRLLDTVGRLTPAKLAEPLPKEFANGPVRTRGDLLAVLGFHDAYHAGQTGLLRRLVGRPPADL